MSAEVAPAKNEARKRRPTSGPRRYAELGGTAWMSCVTTYETRDLAFKVEQRFGLPETKPDVLITGR